ncbi:membrane AbrB-like protein [Bradyrhizobium sp. JR6.1]
MTLIRASMATAIPDRSKVLNGLETLVIGAGGGLLFLWAGLPGGLISGAMCAVAIAALAGRPLAVPPVLTQSVLLLLGISLGSLMSQQLLQHMSSYPLTIALLALATFCSTFGSSVYLQRMHGWDQTSAFLAGSPGALSQITILAAEKGADVAAIAVVQTMRVIILTAALPLVLALTGVTHAAPPPLPTTVASPFGLVALVAGSIGVSLLLRWIKFPASWMFGAMLASSLLHGSGLVDGGLPPWLRNVALVGIGALIGDPVCTHEDLDPAEPRQCRARLIRDRDRNLGRVRRGDRLHHPCAARRRRGRLRARRNGRDAGAGAGADAAHRPDLRRRASSVALPVRHHLDAGHHPPVRTAAGRRRRLGQGSPVNSVILRCERSEPRRMNGPAGGRACFETAASAASSA